MGQPPENITAEDLARSIRHVRAAFAREQLADIDFGGAQALVLIAARPGLSVKQCSELLRVSPPNMSAAISRLVESGLVTRTVSKQDQRLHSLTVTNAGRVRVRDFLAAASD